MNNNVAVTRTFSADEPEALSAAVVEGIAEAEGASPLESPPLAAAIDPDALESLFHGRPTPFRISFSYHGYTVCVESPGVVTVTWKASGETDRSESPA